MAAARGRATRRPPTPGWFPLIAAGGTAALAVLLLGAALERALIGTDADAAERAAREVATHIAAVDAALARAARGLAGRAEVRDGLTGDLPAVRRVFDILRAEGGGPIPDLAITVYDARSAPRAWYGRPAELSPERLLSGPAGFADAGPAGLRLVHVEPIVEARGDSGPPRRLGTVVVERVIASAPANGDPDPAFAVRTSVGSAVLHPADGGAVELDEPLDLQDTGSAVLRVAGGGGTSGADAGGGSDRADNGVGGDAGTDDRGGGTDRADAGGGDSRRVHRFEAAGADGSARVAASISLDEIDRTRARWRHRVAAFFFLVAAATTLAAGGRALAGRTRRRSLRSSVFAAGATMAAGGWLWLAASPDRFAWPLFPPAAYRSLLVPQILRTTADLLLVAAVAAVLAVLAAEGAYRRRSFRPARGSGRRAWSAILLAGAAPAMAALLGIHHRLLQDTVAGASMDLLHTSLQPFDPTRTVLQLALVLASDATVWAMALLMGAALALLVRQPSPDDSAWHPTDPADSQRRPTGSQRRPAIRGAVSRRGLLARQSSPDDSARHPTDPAKNQRRPAKSQRRPAGDDTVSRRRLPASQSPVLGGWPALLLTAAPAGLAAARGWSPLGPALLSCLLASLLAFRGQRLLHWFRRTDPVTRLLAALCAILAPALPLYLSLVSLTDEARRRVVEHDYAVRAAEHPQDLHRQLDRSLEEIDAELAARPARQALPAPPGRTGTGSDAAFRLWRRTALAASRLTSAVEIFGADGELQSRFALNMPDSVTALRWTGTGCEWEVFGEVAPFGSDERRMLHAERGFCGAGGDGPPRPAGGVVVHVTQVDYESLPFIASRSPYVEPAQTGRSPPAAGSPGHEVELVIYGWGRQPAFLSHQSAWPVDDALFQRIYESRSPFWTRLVKDSRRYEVFIANTRAGIYAIGYPAHTAFDHLLHFSELALLVIAAGGLLLSAAVLAALLVPKLRRRLPYREVRTRFALKLQIWFVGAATAPVVVVAIVVQGYFADQLRADVEAGAVRAAAVAKSVIEESVPVQSDGQIITRFTDDILVRIGQVIGQDVNIFDGPRLVATSTRDLYASGVLSTRTPDRVYRAIALDRLPGFVSEEAAGSLRYQLAAAPVRAGGREVILTVPLASRQQEIEGQIDELNRRVLGSALFFAAVVGLIGWAIARSIANPVKRLTRATSRVARGEFGPLVSDLEADRIEKRVAARSADELAVLEADFGRMAAELDAQRRQLEHTHRLEAWTQMARQVAHEIKNPLTPVQLGAEHLLRVHADRGSPLSPVLEGCIESILKQVRILRQIASGFSNFASSPAARLAPTDFAALVNEVVAPYRPGLEGRIALAVDLPPDLPRLQLDPVLMQRAVTNIIENALHAMPDEGTLAIGVARDGDRARLSIRDSGVGIEPDALDRIFEPWFSTRITGTGLGMAIAKRNVELNGGAIAVESEPGRGTAVTMTLPVPEPPGRAEPPVQ